MSFNVINPDENLRNINIIRIIKWSKGVQCPDCHSKNVKELEDFRHQYNYYHECIDCGTKFCITGDIPDDCKFEKGKLYTKKEAMEIFRKIRWGNKKPFCPNCPSDDTYKRKNRNGNWGYSCNVCKRNFSDTTDTIFFKCSPSIEKLLFILSNMYDEDITFGEIAEKIKINDINHVKKIAEKFKDFFESETEQKESIHNIYGFYLDYNLEMWAKKENFPSNIIESKKTRELLFHLIMNYDPNILETFNLKKRK